MVKQWIFWPEETLALFARVPAGIDQASIPISPDTSLPWSQDFTHGGWSARMFLHQMLSGSLSGWMPSDTESLPSLSILATLQVRVGDGNSCSDVLLSYTPDLPELYLTPQMVLGLCRRAIKRKRPLQHVLLRTACGWRRKTLIASSRGGAFEFSFPRKQRPSRGSLEAGLLDLLNVAVAQCSAMP